MLSKLFQRILEMRIARLMSQPRYALSCFGTVGDFRSPPHEKYRLDFIEVTKDRSCNGSLKGYVIQLYALKSG